MKVTVVTPYYFPSLRGNAIAVQRLVSGLQQRNVETQVISLEPQREETLICGEVQRFKPDLIHGIHAYRSGKIAVTLSQKL
ncbi:MAG TPA: hypothetical protein VNM22_22220 [Candidatus Limnocylindrales bacterium]|nr:hypothetical protein [Candidatus Limnocylindrales bacterium]